MKSIMGTAKSSTSDEVALPEVSIIVTSYNEGTELYRTLRSIRENTKIPHEVVVIDDGSTDGSCRVIEGPNVRVFHHSKRMGVAPSRNRGAGIARASTLCFLDGHQRLSPGCIDECVSLARRESAIVSPGVRGFGRFSWTTHGAKFSLCPRNGYFSGTWKLRKPRSRITTSNTLRAPGYVMPRSIYEKVRWSEAMQGWGASEAAIAVNAFFQDIPILQLTGPVARHLFRRSFPYATRWEGVWRNHAVIARICFTDKTWHRHWLPKLFSKHLSSQSLELLESESIALEHAEFQRRKTKDDQSFWTEMAQIQPPAAVPTAAGASQSVAA